VVGQIYYVNMSGKPILTLNQFMRRGQVLAQYRKFLRTARRLPASEREEIEDMVKYDFRMNAKVPASDEEQVKALLQHGERMLKELKQNVDLATAS